MAWRSSQQRHTAPRWRDIMHSIQQDGSATGQAPHEDIRVALEQLLLIPTAASDISDQNVSEDLIFLCQQLNHGSERHGVPGADHRLSSHILFCKLLQHLLSTRCVKLATPAAACIMMVLCKWAGNASFTGSSHGSDTGRSSTEDGQRQRQIEALQALGGLMPDHVPQLSTQERSAALECLQSLAAPPPVNTNASSSIGSQPAPVPEQQFLALQALGACCGRPVGPLPPDCAVAVLGALSAAFTRCCGSGVHLTEDALHSRLFATLLRCLNSALLESKKAWVPHSASIIDALRRMLLYGVPREIRAPAQAPSVTSPAQPPTASVAASSASTLSVPNLQAVSSASPPGINGSASPSQSPRGYCPPHLRASAPAFTPAASTQPLKVATSTPSLPPTQTACPWSDSDASDTERTSFGSSRRSSRPTPSGSSSPSAAAHGGAIDLYKSSRVRLGVLMLLQTMAKSDSKALHQHWTVMLPLQQPLQPRPLSPHLLTMILFDPMPKVRSMAAATLSALLEGPAQKGYLAVAEAKPPTGHGSRPTPVRGFTTLSHSLGQLAVCTHAGLLHAVLHEQNSAVLLVVMRTLCCLVPAAPYERLPVDLLSNVVQALSSRWDAVQLLPVPLHPTELSALHAAYLACLAEVLSTKAPNTALSTFLQSSMANLSTEITPSSPAAPAGTAAAVAPVIHLSPGHLSISAAQPSKSSLVSELLAGCYHPQAVLRIEALAAVRGLAIHYAFTLPDMWTTMCDITRFNLNHSTPSPPSPRATSSHSVPHDTQSLPTTPRNRSSSGGVANIISSSAVPAAESNSASTSPEDKASQHAVKLLGVYLSAQCHLSGYSPADASVTANLLPTPRVKTPSNQPHSPPITVQHPRTHQEKCPISTALSSVATDDEALRLVVMWQEALHVLVPAATLHTSYMVRSAALSCIGEVPEELVCRLSHPMQLSLIKLVAEAASSDAVAAVRATGCKVLGALVMFPRTQQDPAISSTAHIAITAAIHDPVLSVRIAACWALGNMCDAVRLSSSSDPTVEHTCTVVGNAHQTCLTGAQPDDMVPDGHHSLGSTQEHRSRGAPADPQLLALHQFVQLPALCAASLVAGNDVDKVRANGVRAVGNLLAVVQDSGEVPQHMPDVGAWLEQAMACLQSSLTTGNMKVQWNACCATMGLFGNAQLMRSEKVASPITQLLLLLVMLIRDSSNFKIRTHAAAALCALEQRCHFGNVFVDAMLVVWSSLDGLLAGKEGGAASLSSASMLPSSNAGSDNAAGSSVQHPASTALEHQPTRAVDEDGDTEGRFPNYKYISGLSTQLRATLMHLLALTEASDAPRLRDMLSKRADTLRQLLWLQADSVVLQIEGDAGSEVDISSSHAACGLVLHAGSPFSACAASSINISSAHNTQQAAEVASIPLSAVGGVGAAQVMPGSGINEVISALRSMHVRLPSDPFCLRAAGMVFSSSSPSLSMGSSPPYSPSLLSKLMSLGEDRGFDGGHASADPLNPTLTVHSPFGSFSDLQGEAVPSRVQACGMDVPGNVLSVVEAAVARGLSKGGESRMSPSVAEECSGVVAALAGLARVLEPLREKHAVLLGDVEVLAGHLQLLRRVAGFDT